MSQLLTCVHKVKSDGHQHRVIPFLGLATLKAHPVWFLVSGIVASAMVEAQNSGSHGHLLYTVKLLCLLLSAEIPSMTWPGCSPRPVQSA